MPPSSSGRGGRSVAPSFSLTMQQPWVNGVAIENVDMLKVAFNIYIHNLAGDKVASHVSEAHVSAILCPREDIKWAGAKGHVPNGAGAAFRSRRLEGGDERICPVDGEKGRVEYGDGAVLGSDCQVGTGRGEARSEASAAV